MLMQVPNKKLKGKEEPQKEQVPTPEHHVPNNPNRPSIFLSEKELSTPDALVDAEKGPKKVDLHLPWGALKQSAPMSTSGAQTCHPT